MSVSVVPVTASCARFHSLGLTKPSGVRCCHLPVVQEQRKGFPGPQFLFQVFQTTPLAICTLGKITEQPMLLLGNVCMAAFPMTGLENWIWKSFFLHFQGLALGIWLCPISSLCHAPTALPSHLPMPTTAVIAVPFLFQQPARTGSPCS